MLVAVAAVVFSAATVFAQGPTLTVELAGLAADSGAEAQAVVTVLDSDGRPVPGLADEHFQVVLNGSAAPVTSVARGVDSTLGIAVVLAMDVSGSMEGDALREAKAAAHRFLEDLGPQDSAAVLAFNDTVSLVQPFTEDLSRAGAAIDALTAGGATALYQATAESIRLASASGSGRRAVMLLSDGLDNGSALSREEALTTAQTLAVPVFAIGLGDVDRDYLRELAEVSGGQSTETPTPEGLAQLYQQAGELLRGQYVLALDVSDLDLEPSEAVTLRVEVAVDERVGSAERSVCAQQLCVNLSDVEAGERLAAERTIVAQVISAEPVVSVTFLVDGESVEQLADAPYRFSFDSASFEEGEHAIAVEVATSSGATAKAEIAVRTGGGGSGISGTLFALGVLLIAAAGGMFVLSRLRLRYRGREEGPSPGGLWNPPRVPDSGGLRQLLSEDDRAPPPPQQENALGRLRVSGGPLDGQTFPVGGAPASIGASQRCLIRLPEGWEGEDAPVPELARVWVREGRLMLHEVRHLTSTGAVGGAWEILVPGDTFTIGPCTFQFDLGEPESEPASAQEAPNVLRDRDDPLDAPDEPEEPPSEQSGAPGEQQQSAPESRTDRQWPD